MSQLTPNHKFAVLMTIIIALALMATVLGGIYLTTRH